MAHSLYSDEEKMAIINQCRTSGLTDYEWCRQNGLAPGTFYGWIHRLRLKGIEEIPDNPVKYVKTVKNEIVKLEFDAPALNSNYLSNRQAIPEQSDKISANVINISCQGLNINISNDISSELLKTLITSLGGVSC